MSKVTPYLCIKGAASALEFYHQAFGARETLRLTDPGGRIGHAEIRIGDAPLMLADEHPEFGILSAQTLGSSPVGIALEVDDVDAVVRQAVAAGAKLKRPVEDQFYGERSGQVEDPFGYVWHVSTRTEEISPEEMQRRFLALSG
ncbi:MAG TPA: VOC family protein [Thermoanaerobaculia bacterium]|jgi:PhnB protein